MFAHLRGVIHGLPWWGQAIAWPIYWAVYIPTAIVAWVLAQLWHQLRHGAQRFIGPLVLPGILVAIAVGLYVASPQTFGALLNLALVLGAMWVGATMIFRAAFPRRRRPDDHGRRRH